MGSTYRRSFTRKTERSFPTMQATELLNIYSIVVHLSSIIYDRFPYPPRRPLRATRGRYPSRPQVSPASPPPPPPPPAAAPAAVGGGGASPRTRLDVETPPSRIRRRRPPPQLLVAAELPDQAGAALDRGWLLSGGWWAGDRRIRPDLAGAALLRRPARVFAAWSPWWRRCGSFSVS